VNFTGLIIHFFDTDMGSPCGISVFRGNADIEGEVDRGCQYCAKKVKLCDDGHSAFAQSSLVLQTEGRGLQCAEHCP